LSRDGHAVGPPSRVCPPAPEEDETAAERNAQHVGAWSLLKREEPVGHNLEEHPPGMGPIRLQAPSGIFAEIRIPEQPDSFTQGSCGGFHAVVDMDGKRLSVRHRTVDFRPPTGCVLCTQVKFDREVMGELSHPKGRCRDEYIEAVTPAPADTFTAPAPRIAYVDPAPAAFCAAPAPVTEYVDHGNAAAREATAPVIEYVDPAPAYSCATPAPETEYDDHALAATLEAAAPVIENVAKALADGLDAFSWENIWGRRVSYRTAANWGFSAVTSRECHPASRVQAIQMELGTGQYLSFRQLNDGRPLFRQCRPQG